jgi:hypothetical protein
MLQTESVALPFPPTFVFQDVDQQVLEREDIAATAQDAPSAWQAYMSKMLLRERITPRAC